MPVGFDWGKQKLLSWGNTQGFMYAGPPHKSVIPQDPGLTYLRVLGGSPREAGVSCGLLVGGSQGHWWQRPQRILISVRLPFPQQNLALVNSLAAPVLECFRPNKQDRKHSPTHHKQASWAPSYL